MYTTLFINACVVSLLIAGGLFAYRTFSEHTDNELSRAADMRNLLISQQNILDQTRRELLSLKEAANSLGGTLAEVEKRQQEEFLAGKARDTESRQKISELEGKLEEAAEKEIASVIETWRPYIASLLCDFRSAETGKSYRQSQGSGTVMRFPDGTSRVVTNAHILADERGYVMSSCNVFLPDKNVSFTRTTRDAIFSPSGYDWGLLGISEDDASIRPYVFTEANICAAQPNLGDKIVILGYPVIGARNNITATEGIISGFEGDYFITSAKVDRGNSGGAAILQKENCFLGIPTFVALGEVESLARILNIAVVLDEK